MYNYNNVNPVQMCSSSQSIGDFQKCMLAQQHADKIVESQRRQQDIAAVLKPVNEKVEALKKENEKQNKTLENQLEELKRANNVQREQIEKAEKDAILAKKRSTWAFWISTIISVVSLLVSLKGIL